jgi:hypothetical protein
MSRCRPAHIVVLVLAVACALALESVSLAAAPVPVPVPVSPANKSVVTDYQSLSVSRAATASSAALGQAPFVASRSASAPASSHRERVTSAAASSAQRFRR